MEEVIEQEKLIIYCAGSEGEKVYTQLVARGGQVVCFCDNGIAGNGIRRMGLEVYDYDSCKQKFPNAVYIVANKYWIELEIGEILEKDGYIKNETYFLASELEGKGFLNNNYQGLTKILRKQKVIILVGGEKELADLFIEWSSNALADTLVYWVEADDMQKMHEKYEDALWILLKDMVTPIYTNQKDKLKESFLELFKKYNITSYSTYFYSYFDYLETAQHQSTTCIDKIPVEKEGIYIAPRSSAGLTLLGSVFDGHPNLLFLGEPQYHWKLNIYLIVKYVKQKYGCEIANYVIKYVKSFGWDDKLSIKRFGEILYTYFKEDRQYLEQEIFINIYFAYYELLYGKYNRIEKPKIVLELHNCPLKDVTLLWMKNMGFEIVLIEMIRKPYMIFGSEVSYVDCYKKNLPQTLVYRAIFNAGIKDFSIEERKLKKIRIRFEDLKLYPVEIMHKLCDLLNIEWDDELLNTTYSFKKRGKEISGFGIKPVYYPYEEVLDAFDKYRLDIIFNTVSRAYDYSFVEKEKIPFIIDEIKKMFILPFKFEEKMIFSTDEEGRKYRKRFRLLCSAFLEAQLSSNEYTEWYNFGEYLKVENEL